MSDRPVIGIDFDNTIVRYDELIVDEAVQRGLIEPGIVGSKKAIRDRIRELPDGEIEWQKIQAAIYGPRMRDAALIDGVFSFVQRCRRDDLQVFVISHKTEFANYDESGVSLREAALDWMGKRGFFTDRGLGFKRSDVRFGATRLEKIEHIVRAGCTHFIDDLIEMFLESAFPEAVEKVLFDPERQSSPPSGVHVAQSWQEIYAFVFDK